jgi:predicted amidophosphoribosyltransferase
MPMSKGQAFSQIVEELAAELRVPVNRLICREKKRSARQSVAQARRQIARAEYFLCPGAATDARSSRIVLIDDNLTTGATIARAVELLKDAGATSVIPVVLDRTIGPRLAQIIADSQQLGCSH